MNENEIKSDWIDRYHENALTNAELARFNEMHKRSRILRAEVSVDRYIDEILADADAIDFFRKVAAVTRNRKSEKLLGPLILAAASVLFLFATGWLLLMPGREIKVQSRSRENVAMAEKPGHSQQFSFFSASHNNPIGKINATGRGELGLNLQLSSDYNLLPEFELLVGANIRATLFELISPKARLQIPAGSIVNFTWENGDNSMPVTISILNNRGNCIFETDTLHENCYLLDTDYFQKGLFYWRITRDNDLITLGKMTLF